MSNDLSENRHPKLALPIGRVRVPKFLYIILAILGVLVLFVGGLNIYITKSKKIDLISVKLTNLEMAKMTLGWMEGQKDGMGVYNTGSKCDFDFNCQKINSTQISGLSVLWAENKYLQKNNDEKELEIFKKNVVLYADRDVIKRINNNFWNCYFMWDIWSNPNLDQKTKDNLEKICFDSVYSLNYINENGIDIKKEEEITKNLVLDLINNKAIIDEQLVLNSVVDEELIENISGKQHFFNSSDRLARYLWRKDESDLLDGLSDFRLSLKIYKNEQIKVKPYEGCQTGITALMLSFILNDSKYLDLSKIILEQQIQKINKNSIKDASVCGLLADELYKQSKDEIFKEKKNQIINDFLISNFDQKNGGFYSETETQLIKDVKYNGLMVGILVD